MFGKKEKEKRSLEEMFTPRDEIDDCDNAEVGEDNVVEEPECLKKEKNPKKKETRERAEAIKPLDCFGMEEGKTEKWLMKCVKFWFCCMSFLWFLFGATTFAPVIYIGNS
jgi:hypothetical protein